jgi:hypothetical protein
MLFKQLERQMDFYEWFTTFLKEKQIDMSEFCEKGIQVGDVCQAICDTTNEEQSKIKEMLVKLDFKNGNIYHFFNHLSKALNEKRVMERRVEMAHEIIGEQLNNCREKKREKRSN